MHNVNENGHNHIKCTGGKFVKWGLIWFSFGLFFGFGVLIHYLVGSKSNTSGEFLSNVTLWFGSPLAYSAGFIQLGGVAMAAIGAACLALAGCCGPSNSTCCTSSSCCTSHKCGSIMACNLGLALLFLTGYIGYFVIDAMMPGFYYTPIVSGKNLWLILQGISTLIFFIGILLASCCFCRCKREGACK